VGQNRNILTGNKSSETMEQFEHLETILMNQNSIHEEIKGRLKSGNACHHLVQNLLCSSLLSKSGKIKTCRTKTLPVVKLDHSH
jgi:hypothetical protein